MNILLLLQLFGQILAALPKHASANASAVDDAGHSQVDLASLAAILASLQRPAEPTPPSEIRLPRSSAIIAAIVVFGFFALLAAIVSLLLLEVDGINAALAMLCVGFGVLSSKFGTVVDFLFGSSWGSRTKDTWRPIEGQGSVFPVPVPQFTPPQLPQTTPTPARSGSVLTIRGKCSWFGGPKDTGSGDPNEGLALYDEEQAAKRPDLFLSVGPGLFRRLNPDAHYIACRWDYKQTPQTYLRSSKVKVTNERNGKSVAASPVDWGPNERTGRVADLSPGIMAALGLETDNVVMVEVPLAVGITSLEHEQSSHPRILSEAAVKRIFGDFSYVEKGGGRIVIDQSWVSRNIVDVEIPQLVKLGAHAVKAHYKAADALKSVFSDIDAAGLAERIVTFDGTWVPRHMSWNPSRPISRHSWGIAIDINAAWNGYGTDGAAKEDHGSVAELVPIFEKHGFAWGGLWKPLSAKDPMHFEFAREV